MNLARRPPSNALHTMLTYLSACLWLPAPVCLHLLPRAELDEDVPGHGKFYCLSCRCAAHGRAGGWGVGVGMGAGGAGGEVWVSRGGGAEARALGPGARWARRLDGGLLVAALRLGGGPGRRRGRRQAVGRGAGGEGRKGREASHRGVQSLTVFVSRRRRWVCGRREVGKW